MINVYFICRKNHVKWTISLTIHKKKSQLNENSVIIPITLYPSFIGPINSPRVKMEPACGLVRISSAEKRTGVWPASGTRGVPERNHSGGGGGGGGRVAVYI